MNSGPAAGEKSPAALLLRVDNWHSISFGDRSSEPMKTAMERKSKQTAAHLTRKQIKLCYGLHDTIKVMFNQPKHENIHNYQMRVDERLFFILPTKLCQAHWQTLSRKQIDILVNEDVGEFLLENGEHLIKQIEEAE